MQAATATASATARSALRAAARFVLRFQPLRADRAVVCVPCDEAGRVDLDALDEGVRLSYYFARTVIGRDFARPQVQPVGALH